MNGYIHLILVSFSLVVGCDGENRGQSTGTIGVAVESKHKVADGIEYETNDKIDCSEDQHISYPQCWSKLCAKGVIPLKENELVVIFGKRAVVKISGNKWVGLAGGKVLQSVSKIYDTDKGNSLDITHRFDYDNYNSECIILAKSKGKDIIGEQTFYSSSPSIRINKRINNEQRKLFENHFGKCEMVQRPPGDKPATCVKPEIYGVSDIEQNGKLEFWYKWFRYHCDGIKVAEVTKEKAKVIAEFAFCD